MLKIAPLVLLAAGTLLIFAIANSDNNTTTENNAYIRVSNCVLSIPATDRTQQDIEQCYQEVEEDLSLESELHRYNNGR